MTIIEIRKKFYNVPTQWNELTAEQLLAVMMAFENKKYTEDKRVLKLLKVLLDVSYFTWLRWKAEDIEEFIYLVGFLYQGNTGLTKQLITAYDSLYGPADNIGNVSMGEFTFAEHYFMGWQENRDDEELLNRLVAVLYRPCKRKYDFKKNAEGDCRIPFNENVSAYYSDAVVSGWSKHVKMAIATWYAGCRQQLVDDNPDVFGGNGEAGKYGLISIMRSIAKDGVHGDFESVEKKSVHLMMIELNEVVEEGKRMEAELKKAK